MINFIIPEKVYYHNVIYSMINPIIKYLSNYIITDIAMDDCVNIHFFNEPIYVEKVGLKGINFMIPHGIGDKGWRNINSNQFDYVSAPSEYWKDVLIKRDIKEEKIIICGYPKIDLFFDGNLQKQLSNKPTVLWCPTHEKSISSNPKFKEYISLIPPDYNFISHEHPFNDEHHTATVQSLINADVVITDYSSMIFEAWAIGKPVIFPDWIIQDRMEMVKSYILEKRVYLEDIGYHCNNIDELIKSIHIALNNTLDDKVVNFINKILPIEFRGNSGKIIADIILEMEKNI